MRREARRLYWLLAVAAVLCLSLPKRGVEGFQGYTAAFFSPFWNQLTTLAVKTQSGLGEAKDSRMPASGKERLQQLETENLLLKERLKEVQELLLSEIERTSLMVSWSHERGKAVGDEYSIRRRTELERLLDTYSDSFVARVIYRPPASWNHCLWINVGRENNLLAKRQVICKNSPVVVGYSLIGVVDYVGKHQSRVRLISDVSVHPSVRALRGGGQQLEISRHLDALIEGLSSQEMWVQANRSVLEQLKSLRHQWEAPSRSWYLAKGELNGAGKAAWRKEGVVLKGSGFNYDYADEEGPARDLRQSILKTNDLLVTTGMDGIFPKGLLVGRVISIHPLKEGDYYYSLEAEPTAGDFDQISWVTVLPPLGNQDIQAAMR